MSSDNTRAEAEKYRSLFEGAQSSLSDLSARQAQALSRVGRLRNAVVTVLRRNFMELSAQAEAQLGTRLSDVDDEILIAYLEAFVAAASRGDQRATLNAMAEAVAALGIPLRGEEPLLWVEQIHAHRVAVQREQSRTSTQPPAKNAEEPVHPVSQRVSETTAAAQPSLPESEPEDYWGWEPGTTLKGLFDDGDQSRLGSLFDDVETPELWDSDLGETRSTDGQWAPSPVAPVDPSKKSPERSAQARPSAPETVKSPAAKPKTPAKTSKTTETEPAKKRDHTNAAPNTAPDATPDAAPDAAPAVVPKVPAGSEPVTSTQPQAATPAKTTPAETTVEPVRPSPPIVDSTMTEAPETGVGVETPLRPELFPPAPTRRKRTREVRTQATPPEEGLPFKSGNAVLDDPMRQALLAASSIPRPVFTRDLIAVAGDEAIVDAWEAECRAEVSTSPVRFVAPKSRHRQRGRLVAVEQGAAKPADWWYQAVSRYRAGRLYELGVLLHRVGDEIVSFQLGEQVCLFRLNTPRGLVGVVVVLDIAAEDNPEVRQELTDVVESLMGERLTLLAVLTASGEPGSLEGLAGGLEQIALERQWRPTFPLVAARSWEYADDRGSSAVMVLNQS